MRQRKSILSISLLLLLSVLVATSCIATASATVTTYTYTSYEDSPGGHIPYSVGYPIQVHPYTNDPSVTKVVVTWYAPDGSTKYTDTLTTKTQQGSFYYFGPDSEIPTCAGVWEITIVFFSGTGQQTDVEQATVGPFTTEYIPVVTPEFPFLGTALATVIALLAILFYVKKVKTPLTPM